MTFGGHARVDEDLRHRVLRRGRFLPLIGGPQVANVIGRVVIADELEGVGHRGDEVFLSNRRHGMWSVRMCLEIIPPASDHSRRSRQDLKPEN